MEGPRGVVVVMNAESERGREERESEWCGWSESVTKISTLTWFWCLG